MQSELKYYFEEWKKYLNPNERRDFENSMIRDPKLTKMSQFFAVLTSSSLTPYYSYRAFALQEICSTSHLNIVLEARRRQHMRQHDENEKNESQNSSEW